MDVCDLTDKQTLLSFQTTMKQYLYKANKIQTSFQLDIHAQAYDFTRRWEFK